MSAHKNRLNRQSWELFGGGGVWRWKEVAEVERAGGEKA